MAGMILKRSEVVKCSEVVKRSEVVNYACSDSLLLTPLCCDDIHDVTPRVSALAGCDSRPRHQETMGDIPAQTRFESLSKQSNDPPLLRVNTLGSGEDKLKLKELMELCTKLSDKVLNLETTKTAQAKEIANLKKRVKKLEKKKKSRTYEHKRLYKVGLSARIVSSDDEASLGDQEDASK
ncbi:hypothetical protein Tco_1509113 [Tanacetum coccineum]